MTATMSTPTVDDLPGIIDAVSSWQREGAPMQVHPGDLGWYERFGTEALARALRVWTWGRAQSRDQARSRSEQIAAVGFLDETELIRMAMDPELFDDDELASDIADDLVSRLDDLLPAGAGIVEARFGGALARVLAQRGWSDDEPWTPLHRDLARPVPPGALVIRVVGWELVEDRIRVEASAFPGASLSTERWHQMARGHAYRHGRCLVGYDERGSAVAATTIWSAGTRRPGIIEPLGVHQEHRGRGHGRAITLAAAEALRGMGASSAMVATPSSNAAAVAAYRSAGFESLGEATDLRRPAAALAAHITPRE